MKKKKNWRKLNGNKSATLTTCVTKEAGAHNPERARLVTAFSQYHAFKNDFGANFEYLLNSTNQSAKPTDLKMIFLPFNDV